MAPERAQTAASLDVPHLDRLITRAGDDSLAIEFETIHTVGMPTEVHGLWN